MKNKKGLIIGSVIAIIVIVAIVIVVLYFTTDLLKTNQQLFYKYLAKTQIVDTNYLQKYAEVNERLTKNSNSSSATVDIATAVPNQETGVADMQPLFTIKSNRLVNVPFKQTYRDFTFSSNNQNWLTLKYMRDDNLYAIGADNILIKYIAVENSNLKELFTKMGVQDVSNIPDTITNNYEELLKVDEETLKALSTTYGTLIYHHINEANYYKTINEDKTETIGVSLSLQETRNLIKTILETVKNDNILLNLIASKAQILGYTEVTVPSIQTELQSMLDKAATVQDTQDVEDFFGMSVTKKGSNVIKLKVDTKKRQRDDITEPLEMQNITNTMSTNLMTNMETNSNGLNVNDIALPHIDNGSDVVAHIVKAGFELDFSQANTLKISCKENEQETTKLQIDYSFSENNLILNLLMESLEEETNNATIKMQYEVNNYQTDNIAQNYAMNIGYGAEVSYQVKLSNETTLKQDVQIEKLTTENSEKLNDMTPERISELFTAIGNRVIELYGNSFMSNGIINHAKSSQKDYEDAQKREQELLQEYQKQMNPVS